MINDVPSKTCLITAIYRALHQQVDRGRIFDDRIAKRIVGISGIGLRLLSAISFRDKRLRYLFSARSAASEMHLSEAITERGVSQIVLLGAGLDTLPYRNTHGNDVTFFEIDHPATQQWKLSRLKSAKISIPSNVRLAPCDLETGTLFDRLQELGFDRARRSYFLWLGTIPYLTDETALSILESISLLEGGAEVVFDYGEPPSDAATDCGREAYPVTGATASREDEPYISTLNRDAIFTKMSAMGYDIQFDLDHIELLQVFVPKDEVDALMDRRSHHSIDGRRICYGMSAGPKQQVHA